MGSGPCDRVAPGERSARRAVEVVTGYCGCCGNPVRPADALWCFRCRQSPKHLGSGVVAPHERTYFATHGEDCPFQVGATTSDNASPSEDR